MWPFTLISTHQTLLAEIQRLQEIVDNQSRHIHWLDTLLSQVTHHPPPPAPWLPRSKPPWPTSLRSKLSTPSASRIRGAEAVTIMDRTARRLEEEKAAVQTTFKVPGYMEAPTPIPPTEIPSGKSVGGGFSSPPSDPPLGPSPTPGSPSTES